MIENTFNSRNYGERQSRDQSRYKNQADTKVGHDKTGMFIWNMKKNDIRLIEVGIKSQDLFQTVETEKLRKYALLANKLTIIYEYKIRTIFFCINMRWNSYEKTQEDSKCLKQHQSIHPNRSIAQNS